MGKLVTPPILSAEADHSIGTVARPTTTVALVARASSANALGAPSLDALTCEGICCVEEAMYTSISGRGLQDLYLMASWYGHLAQITIHV